MMIDNNYIEELYKFLSHEQWTSSIVSKLHKEEFQELVQILFFKAEHDDKIIVLDDKELDAMLHQIMLIHDTMKMEREKKRQQNESPLADITGV